LTELLIFATAVAPITWQRCILGALKRLMRLSFDVFELATPSLPFRRGHDGA
jgi:hypothetical protein